MVAPLMVAAHGARLVVVRLVVIAFMVMVMVMLSVQSLSV